MGVTHVCFGLSYLLAFALELAGQARPGRGVRVAGLVAGTAGLAAHTIFLVAHHPNPASAYGALLLLAWVLAIFYLYGSVHHRSQAWGLFVLPVVLILSWLSFAFYRTADEPGPWLAGDRMWGAVHGILVLAASVGITVGFLASVMYLVQARRLRMKRNPLGGLRLLSLERLETMNRRAINWAFPLLTVGLLLGVIRVPSAEVSASSWADPKILSTIGLWVVALVLLYLRYGAHLPPRRLALLTIVVFGLMLVTLIASHPLAAGEVSP
jgi:ABC-type transport system involved in cytochrome c biogenesis permease subunit